MSNNWLSFEIVSMREQREAREITKPVQVPQKKKTLKTKKGRRTSSLFLPLSWEFDLGTRLKSADRVD